jgi:hypothetical protein
MFGARSLLDRVFSLLRFALEPELRRSELEPSTLSPNPYPIDYTPFDRPFGGQGDAVNGFSAFNGTVEDRCPIGKFATCRMALRMSAHW